MLSGGWWLVVGGWWLVVGGWWLVRVGLAEGMGCMRWHIVPRPPSPVPRPSSLDFTFYPLSHLLDLVNTAC